MKHITFLFVITVLLVGLGSNASAQQKQDGKDGKTAVTKQTTQNPGPRFIDEDGDGICDHQADGTSQQRQHARQGTGNGNGTGTGSCTGTAQRARLRDGSCGDGAAPSGATRKGRQQAK
ncbi:MAG: hypothetical protein IH600_11500 [Bacteroidetes bacterium]|nr:hypothetical protein [Bacteroidota bacterium]